MEALSAEQQAFLQNGSARPLTLADDDPHPSTKYPRTEGQHVSSGGAQNLQTEPLGTNRTSRPSKGACFKPCAVQSVTLRLRQPIAQALRTASIERSLNYFEPFTQQAIVESALSTWLEQNGYDIEA